MKLQLRHYLVFSSLFLGLSSTLPAQAPQGDKEPLLQLEPGGPTALVTALCFSPDGTKLYAAGFDKVVRVWERQPGGQFGLLRDVTYRVPIGPGTNGAINAMALSPDGQWLAVGGLGMIREGAGFREMGWLWPAASLSPEMWQDRGVIHVFNTKQNTVKTLRGHAGAVLAISFAPDTRSQPPRLVSAARERHSETDKYMGSVRIWELESGKQLSRRDDLPDPGGSRPALSVISMGPKLTDLQVALAWQDQKLRVWDVANNRMEQVPDGELNNMVQHVAPSQFITGSFTRGTGTGQITNWKLNPQGQPEARNTAKFAPVPEGEGFAYTYPRVLALLDKQAVMIARRVFQTRVKAPPDRAEPAEQTEPRFPNYTMYLVDLRPENFGKVLRETILWTGGEQLPAMAVSGDGKTLAVAGHPDNGIRLFALSQLEAGQTQPQVLTSGGTRWQQVAFARNDQDNRLGLVLKPGMASRSMAQRRFLFDFAQRRLTTDTEGWKNHSPDPSGWSLDFDPLADAGTFTVQQNGRAVSTIRMKARETVTDYALLPPNANSSLKFPVVAIAYLDANRQPLLCLYQGQSGEELRRLTAHQGPIRSIAFERNGKFLASVADDQTVCIWTMQDLEQIVGKFGQLAGLAVKAENEQLSVARLDNPKLQGLRVGDLIDGLVQDKQQLQRLSSTRDFYDAMLLTLPGQNVTLRVRQPGGQPRDVIIPVVQAVDDRKPLFSLFITTGEKAEDREWVGWSPHGHYDAKDQQAERLLVWHFNTNQADKPTTSAEAKDPALRQQFLKPRLLEHLLAAGNLTDALGKYRKPVAAPNLTLVMEEDAAVMQEQPGLVTVRQPRVKVKVAIIEPALSELASLTWQLDDQPVQTEDLAKLTSPELTLSVDLSPRRLHLLRVVATTKEQQPKTARREIALRHVPPRPVVRCLLPERQTVQEAKFSLRASIRTGSTGQPVKFTLLHEHQGQTVNQQAKDVPAEEQLAQELTLRPGENIIRLKAENQGATPVTNALETETQTLVVTLAPKANALAPEIRLELVTDKEKGAKQLIRRDEVIKVQQSSIVLQGSVNAQSSENLKQVEFGVNGKKIAGVAAPAAKGTLALTETVPLQPGRNKLTLTATSDTSPEASLPFEVDYQPVLPTLEIVSPQCDDTVHDSPQIKLVGNVAWSSDPQIAEAVVQVNGVVVTKLKLEPGKNKLEVPLELKPRVNRIQVQVQNEWGAVTSSEPLFVSYLRPPRGLTVNPPSEDGKSLVTLEARVQSPADLPVKSNHVAAKINGHALPSESINLRQVAQKEGMNTWSVRIADVPLKEGQQNLFEMQVRNDEAEIKEPAQLRLTGPKPQGSPPVIEFLQPATDTRVAEPALKIQFRVRSQSDLQRLSLKIGDELVNLKDLKRTSENIYTREVNLKPGENLLQVEALNTVGLQTSKLTVNYVALPVRLLLTDPLPVSVNEDQIVLPEAATGTVALRGQVVWPATPQQLPADARVKVYVNGFLQPPAQLIRTTDPKRYEFVTSAYLNQKENRIEMEIPGVAQERQRRQVILVTCAKPERIRTRLLIVGVGLDQNLPTEALMQRATKLFQDNNQWPFVLAEPPTVLSGNSASNGQVLRALVTMNSKIQRSAAAGSPRDIIVVYYAGHEVIDPQLGHFLLTASSRTDPRVDRSGISVQYLEDILGRTYGARMLLLDVVRSDSKESQANVSVLDRIASWSDASPIAVARATQSASAPGADDFRLLSAWQAVLPTAQRFRDVEEGIKGKLLPKQNGTSTFRQYLRPLADVRLKGS